MAGLLSLFEKKRKEYFCSAVIVAAGSATRMEGIDKVIAPLGELPILVHTLYAFQDAPCIHEIVVVTREGLLGEVSRLCKEFDLNKVRKIVVGGAERTLSVQKGISECSAQADLIAIHDGARPLVTRQIIEQTVAVAAKTGAAVPAVPITDTVKREKDGLLVETADRSQLRGVQTPQVFDAGLIRTAIAKAVEDGVSLTDDCAAVERLGMKISITPGSRENMKITTPIDLIFGEAILEARGRGEL